MIFIKTVQTPVMDITKKKVTFQFDFMNKLIVIQQSFYPPNVR